MWRRLSVLMGIAFIAAGCGADDPKRLHREVDRLIQPGMSMAAAEQALRGADFSCGPDLRGRDCSRSRSEAVIITCVQRVILIPDSQGATLVGFDMPRKVACLGTP
jgi:hypothetical protein